jgi:hypothetical protein
LKGRPIIGASTLTSNDYKETYNSLPFADTMAKVYQYFVASNMNCPNTSDPLFLIFRVQSLLKKTYDDMASAINSSFGDNSLNGNMIFYLNGDRTLDNTLLSSLTNDKVQGCKVVIIVDVSGMQKDFYRKSKLSLMSALDIGNGDNIIHRESDLVQKPDMDGLSASTLSFLYPDFSNTSNNYNFVNGLNYKINFIGLSFQTNDLHLKVYNDMFSNSSIITVEDGCVQGGFGSAVLEFMADHGYSARVKRLGIPDKIVEHGTQPELWSECGYDAEAIYLASMEILEKVNNA